MSEAPAVVETERHGSVLVIRLSSEKTNNALSNSVREALSAAFQIAIADRAIRAVCLSAKGPNFCSGGDLNALQLIRSDPWAVHQRFRDMGRWFLPMQRIEKPVVSAVRGFAVGGGFGLALLGDLVVASETARFRASWLKLGILPDALALYTLPRLVGLARARRMFITEATLDAKEARAMSLVAEVVPDSELDARAMELAHAFAEGPAEVWGLTKLLLARTFESSLDDMFLYEGLGQVVAMGGPEFEARAGATLRKEQMKPSVADLLNAKQKE